MLQYNKLVGFMVSTGIRIRILQELHPELKLFFKAAEKATMDKLFSDHFENFCADNTQLVKDYPHIPEFIENYKTLLNRSYHGDPVGSVLNLEGEKLRSLTTLLENRYKLDGLYKNSAAELSEEERRDYLKECLNKISSASAKTVGVIKGLLYGGIISDAIKVYSTGLHSAQIAPASLQMKENDHASELQETLAANLFSHGITNSSLENNCETITKDCLYKLGMYMASAGHHTYKHRVNKNVHIKENGKKVQKYHIGDESLELFPLSKDMPESTRRLKTNASIKIGSREYNIMFRETFTHFTQQIIEHFKDKLDRTIFRGQ